MQLRQTLILGTIVGAVAGLAIKTLRVLGWEWMPAALVGGAAAALLGFVLLRVWFARPASAASNQAAQK